MPNWEQIVHEHGPTVWRVLWRYLSDEEAVDEAFQETFVSAVQLARREEVSNWEALLVRLATCRAMDGLRARYRRGGQRDWQQASGDALSDVSTSAAGPVEIAVATELSDRLCLALAELPERQAEVFALDALEGWSNDRIAMHLDITANAVRVNAHRARERLRELLRDD